MAPSAGQAVKRSGRPQALFVLEASGTLGGGHLMRCRALAGALEPSHDPVMALNRSASSLAGLRGSFQDGEAEQYLGDLSSLPSIPDLIIVDHYGIDAESEAPLRSRGSRIAVIDDLADRPHDCEVLIDSNPLADVGSYRRLTGRNCTLLLGTDYALLRPQFRAMRRSHPRRPPAPCKPVRLLVAMGATDPTGATSRVLDECERVEVALHVTVIISSLSPHLDRLRASVARRPYPLALAVDASDVARLCGNHDIAVGAPATSQLERACSGLPSILLTTAPNQAQLSAALGQSGSALCLGLLDTVPPGAIADSIERLAADHELQSRLQASGQRMVDGWGAERVAGHLIGPLTTKDGRGLVGRRLRPEDAEPILSWRLPVSSRQYLRNPGMPTPSEHADWMLQRLGSVDGLTEIIELDGEPVAMVRLDPVPGTDHSKYEVSLIVAPEHQGLGIGKMALRYLEAFDPKVARVACIHPDNKASLKTFRGCGYGERPERRIMLMHPGGQDARS